MPKKPTPRKREDTGLRVHFANGQSHEVWHNAPIDTIEKNGVVLWQREQLEHRDREGRLLGFENPYKRRKGGRERRTG